MLAIMEFKRDIAKAIERYQRLWSFQELDPPLVMIDIPESPITSGGHDCGFWKDCDGLVEKYLGWLALRNEIADDTVPMLRPSFSHVALPAILGAEPELHNTSLWVHPILEKLEDYKTLAFGQEGRWLGVFQRYYERLLELAAGRFAVGLYEVPGPADLMGALRGFETILMDLYDQPELVKQFAGWAGEIAVAFRGWLGGVLAQQENYGGCWVGNAWAPEDTICACEHSTVSYSPALYAEFLKPANDVMFGEYGHAVTYIYATAGAQHSADYFCRGRPVWVNSCDGNPSAEIIEQFGGQAIVTLRTNPADFRGLYDRHGGRGMAYLVSCASLDEARTFSKSVGF